jgi:hypothetical protein
LTYIDRPRPEYELLLILQYLRGPHDFRSKKFSLPGSRGTLSEKLDFGKFFFIAEIYFGIFFLHNKFISETYFLIMKRFPKVANKWGI